MAPVDSEAVMWLVGYFTTSFRLIEPNREALPVTFMQAEMCALMEEKTVCSLGMICSFTWDDLFIHLGRSVHSLGMLCSFTWDAAEKLAFISRELVQASRIDR